MLDKFEKESDDIRELLKAERFNNDVSEISKSAKELSVLSEKMKNLDEYSKKHRKFEEVLEITEFTNFKDFRDLKTQFTVKEKIYNGIVELEKLAKDWNEKCFNTIDVKELTSICDSYTKNLLTGERQIPDNKALPIFKKNLFVFKDAIPVISALRCPYLEENDFTKIQELLQTEINFKEDT